MIEIASKDFLKVFINKAPLLLLLFCAQKRSSVKVSVETDIKLTPNKKTKKSSEYESVAH